MLAVINVELNLEKKNAIITGLILAGCYHYKTSPGYKNLLGNYSW